MVKLLFLFSLTGLMSICNPQRPDVEAEITIPTTYDEQIDPELDLLKDSIFRNLPDYKQTSTIKGKQPYAGKSVDQERKTATNRLNEMSVERKIHP